jgi:hypothetical protein
MNQLTRKFISIFFSTVFFLASGTGQLIHAHFHNHNYKLQTDKNQSALNTPHNYCCALQLTLPEFFQSGNNALLNIKVSKELLFADQEPAIPHLFSFRNSDRAPPVLA